MAQSSRSTLEPISLPVLTIALLHLLAGVILIQHFMPDGWQVKAQAKPREEFLWMDPAKFSFETLMEPEVAETPPVPVQEQKKEEGASPLPAMAKAPAVILPTLTPGKLIGDEEVAATLAAAAELPTYPLPVVPPSAGGMRPSRESNKYITLSPVTEPTGKTIAEPAFNLLDMARLDAKSTSPHTPRMDGLDQVDRSVQEIYMKEWQAPLVLLVPANQRSASLEIELKKDGSIVSFRLVDASGSEVMDQSILDAAERIKKIPVTLPSSFAKESYLLQVHFQIE